MQLKSVVHRVQKHRSFVYGKARLVQRGPEALEVEVRRRAYSRSNVFGLRKCETGLRHTAYAALRVHPAVGHAGHGLFPNSVIGLSAA